MLIVYFGTFITILIGTKHVLNSNVLRSDENKIEWR